MRSMHGRGVSLVELLVASAIALVVVAAGGSVVATQHLAAQKLQSEARLMQDLRAAADLVARDLRRAGHWSAAASSVRVGDDAVLANPHASITPAAGAASAIALSFSTSEGGDPAMVDDNDRFGFRLRAGAIEMQLGARNWQALSDPATVVVTTLAVEPHVEEISLATFCERPCGAASTTCPPRQQVRSYAITLAGRSPADASVARTLRTTVRVRNDAVVGSCEA